MLKSHRFFFKGTRAMLTSRLVIHTPLYLLGQKHIFICFNLQPKIVSNTFLQQYREQFTSQHISQYCDPRGSIVIIR